VPDGSAFATEDGVGGVVVAVPIGEVGVDVGLGVDVGVGVGVVKTPQALKSIAAKITDTSKIRLIIIHLSFGIIYYRKLSIKRSCGRSCKGLQWKMRVMKV
jgi:hypothetical protein